MKISVILILVMLVLGGCIEDKKVTQSPESLLTENVEVMQSPRATSTFESTDDYSYQDPTFSKEKKIPEINLESFSSRYVRKNSKKLKDKWSSDCNLTEKYYAVFHLNINNNHNRTLDFKLLDLQLATGDEKFNATTIYSEELYPDLNLIEENVTILPGQTINGSVVFQVNSSDSKSFLLLYNSTPLILPSIQKSIETQTTAELFNYSIAFGIPQFNLGNIRDVNIEDLGPDELSFEHLPLVWPNWIDRSTIEFYKKLDSQNLENNYIRKKNMDLLSTIIEFYIRRKNKDLPATIIEYSITVMPDRNITLLPGDRFIIRDEVEKEIINESLSSGDTGVAILNNQMYELYSKDIPQMDFTNASVVQMSFYNSYGTGGLSGRITQNNQFLIIDGNQNIVIALCHQGHFVS